MNANKSYHKKLCFLMCARYAYKIKAKQTASNRTTFSVFAIGKFHCWRPVMWSSCILFYVCLAIFFSLRHKFEKKTMCFILLCAVYGLYFICRWFCFTSYLLTSKKLFHCGLTIFIFMFFHCCCYELWVLEISVNSLIFRNELTSSASVWVQFH